MKEFKITIDVPLDTLIKINAVVTLYNLDCEKRGAGFLGYQDLEVEISELLKQRHRVNGKKIGEKSDE